MFGDVIFVVSGKGGVGKSTVAANLAVSFATEGESVGLLDADLHGPSQSEMFGAFESPRISQGRIQPTRRHGVRLLSSGMLGGKSKAFVWRGPLLRGVLRQFLYDADWGRLNYFIVDLPPGTGETLIALLRWIRPRHIIAVVTPQRVAAADTRRALGMLEGLGLSTAVIVENMATLKCSACGVSSSVFPGSGGLVLAQEYAVAHVARLPLLSAYASSGDEGVPAVINDAAPVAVKDSFAEIVGWLRAQ